jgi:hypothetical protein
MKRAADLDEKKTVTKKQAVRPAGILCALILIGGGCLLTPAQQMQLSRTPRSGNTQKLAAPALIMRVARNAKSFAVWRNGSLFISVGQTAELKGVLPPGTYLLRTSAGGSVTIYLTTRFRAESVILWGRQRAVLKPTWDGNYVVLATPTRITAAAYDGTKGMGIFDHMTRILYYVSPHNRPDPGPRVIGGRGGKTLVGQVLPPGVYHVVPGRGTGDGIVKGEITLSVGPGGG